MINYLVLDIDGTLTDGGIYYDENGNEIKKFNIKDGMGIKLAQEANIEIVVITGRHCNANKKRMKELKVEYLYEDIADKYLFLEKWMMDNNVDKSEVAYIGDDINDLKSMGLCCFVGCPIDSCQEVRNVADYISNLPGGKGAVRDIIEYYLKKENKWDEVLTLWKI